MMRLCATLAILAALSSPAYSWDKECQTATEHEFLVSVIKNQPTVYVASDKMLAETLKADNASRALLKKWDLQADRMLIGIFKYVDKPGNAVGTMMFKNDCMVPGSETVETEEEFRYRVYHMGLTKEDFSTPVALPVIKG